MAWSKWYNFNDETVKKQVGEQKSGIYRIALRNENLGFKIETRKIKNSEKSIWTLSEDEMSTSMKNKVLKTRLLIGNHGKNIYTNLVYIGRSYDIRDRLLQHLSNTKGKGNTGIRRLLDNKIELRFSYLSVSDIVKAEQNFYNEFVAKIGFCPPCDNNSNECKAADGICLRCYLLVLNGKEKKRLPIC